MESGPKQNTVIQELRRYGTFTTAQAREHGLSPRMLHYYLSKGLIERVSHGQYAFSDQLGLDFQSIIREKLAVVPQAVVGLESALKLYDLTEQARGGIDLLVPKSNVPKRALTDVHLTRVKGELHCKGVHRVSGLPVTTIERTLIDFLRIKKSITRALEVLQTARGKGIEVDLTQMKKMAVEFRVQKRFNQLMEAYL